MARRTYQYSIICFLTWQFQEKNTSLFHRHIHTSLLSRGRLLVELVRVQCVTGLIPACACFLASLILIVKKRTPLIYLTFKSYLKAVTFPVTLLSFWSVFLPSTHTYSLAGVSEVGEMSSESVENGCTSSHGYKCGWENSLHFSM